MNNFEDLPRDLTENFKELFQAAEAAWREEGAYEYENVEWLFLPFSS